MYHTTGLPKPFQKTVLLFLLFPNQKKFGSVKIRYKVDASTILTYLVEVNQVFGLRLY